MELASGCQFYQYCDPKRSEKLEGNAEASRVTVLFDRSDVIVQNIAIVATANAAGVVLVDVIGFLSEGKAAIGYFLDEGRKHIGAN